MSRKNPFLVLGLMALMAVGFAACGEDEKPSASGQGFEVLPSDRTLGNPKSKVVLIEYAELHRSSPQAVIIGRTWEGLRRWSVATIMPRANGKAILSRRTTP